MLLDLKSLSVSPHLGTVALGLFPRVACMPLYSPLAWKKKKKSFVRTQGQLFVLPQLWITFFFFFRIGGKSFAAKIILERKKRVQNRIGPKETTLNNFNFRYLRNWKWTAVCLLDREMFQTLFNLLAAARIVYWIWRSKCVCTTGYVLVPALHGQ